MHPTAIHVLSHVIQSKCNHSEVCPLPDAEPCRAWKLFRIRGSSVFLPPFAHFEAH